MFNRYVRQSLKFQLKLLILSQALNFQSAKMPTQVEVVFLFVCSFSLSYKLYSFDCLAFNFLSISYFSHSSLLKVAFTLIISKSSFTSTSD